VIAAGDNLPALQANVSAAQTFANNHLATSWLPLP
jgi:hypothetical protein